VDDRNRMSYSGMGISKMLVAYDDQENNWKNRRVEFILVE
jgi:flagellar motor protein MotB